METTTWTWALVAACVLLAATLAFTVRRLRSGRADLAVTRHEAERLRTLARARAERSSVLSHEIRTPLTLVQGAAELLAEETPGPLNDHQRRFVDTIVDNCGQMIAMAEDLLTAARLEARLFELHLERTDVRALARQTVREMRRMHGVTVLLDSRGAPLWLDLDRNLVRQALWNLVNNAARHSGAEVTITVRITVGDDDVLVSVADDGPGMTAAERDTLFLPFVVGGGPGRGTGLGMMITKEIVELHGGRIFVDTATRAGTVVLLTLPLRATAVAAEPADGGSR
ncbi:sensor histidine kinase [Sanguibacter sp. A247]|uniref:sensor histidine kinase n=1 Tax=unclassified Sanguibacter TaxID=2645534 RepID=UPI003FD6D330